MTRTASTKRRDFHVLICGGGVAGLEAMLALRELAGEIVDVELVAPEHHFFYRPLAVAEPFGGPRVFSWELADLARAAGAEFAPGELRRLDIQAHVAELASGQEVGYDALLLACGARTQVAVAGALTFRGPADVERFRALLDEVKSGVYKRLVFAVPSGIVWPLPLYELALLTATEFEREGHEVALVIVTSEPRPLALFGTSASAAVEALLTEHGIDVRASTYPAEVTDGVLRCVPGGEIAADRVVALPRLTGPSIEGVQRDRNGFVLTDTHGRVAGARDVYAAGDLTAFPIKQGGLAAQQADAAAEAIAAHAGAIPEARPFRPVLRALLLTGGTPSFLRVELGGGHGETSTASDEPLWWPPGKIVGRYLAPFLAELGLAEAPAQGPEDDVLRIEVDAAAVHELMLPGGG
jgi:sulfide:quinone oxidoreductase